MTGSSILMIYTGGTIGMKQDPKDQTLKPFDFSQILEEVPELGKYALNIDSYTFNPLIDSSDVEPSLWQSLATLIKDRYDEYDGFVVLHGTDTMAYSASALSFMLDNLTKPVIFTGSQLPIGVPRTDGKENLISAVEIAAAKDEDGHSLVPEVCIFFDSQLLRGNRCTKVSSEEFRAFRSPNYPALAEAGINIRYNRKAIAELSAEVESVVDMLSNTRNQMVLNKAMDFPIVRNLIAYQPCRHAGLGTALACLVPLSVPAYLVGARYQATLRRELRQTATVCSQLCAILRGEYTREMEYNVS